MGGGIVSFLQHSVWHSRESNVLQNISRAFLIIVFDEDGGSQVRLALQIYNHRQLTWDFNILAGLWPLIGLGEQLTTLVQDNGSEIGNVVLKPRHAPNFYGCLVLSVELDCFSSKMAKVQYPC